LHSQLKQYYIILDSLLDFVGIFQLFWKSTCCVYWCDFRKVWFLW